MFLQKNMGRYLTLATLNVALAFILNFLIDSENLIINLYNEVFTQEQIESVLNLKNKWQWVGYLLIPLLLLIKICVIAAIIDMGCFFFDKSIKYKTCFNIVIKAEFIFLLVIVFKTIWFYVFQQDYTLEDLQYFYPLSALNITCYTHLESWYIYPLQVLNIFEVMYWFLLAYLLAKELKISVSKGLSIVASSYGVGLLIWVVAVMFFTLNMS